MGRGPIGNEDCQPKDEDQPGGKDLKVGVAGRYGGNLTRKRNLIIAH